MAGIYSQGGSAGHRYAGWLETVEAKNFQFGGKVFNGSPSAIYVGSKMVWWYWLKPATRQAIMDAFGQRDGWAVINATNAYLTQLAASDRDKATALAGFINEDPMMVCSLGLSVEGVTMPWRYIENDGKAYVDTNIFLSGDGYYFDTKFKAANISSKAVLGCQIQDPTLLVLYNGNLYCYGSTGATTNRVKSGIYTTGVSDVTFSGVGDQVTVKHNGTTETYSVSTSFTTMNKPLLLFAYWNNGAIQSDRIITAGIAKFILKQGNTELREMYPMKRTINDVVVCGMIDVISGTFFTNANSQGSFTIPDISYTPSTP